MRERPILWCTHVQRVCWVCVPHILKLIKIIDGFRILNL